DRRCPVLRQIDAVACRRSALAQSANRDVGRSVRTRSEVEGGDDQWIRRLRAETAQGTADDAEQVSSVDCTCHLPTGIEFRAEAVVALALDGGRAGEFTGGCLGHALTLPITERTSSQISCSARAPFVSVAVVARHPSQQLLILLSVVAESGDESRRLLPAELHHGAAASADEQETGLGDPIVEWIGFQAHHRTPSSPAAPRCRQLSL